MLQPTAPFFVADIRMPEATHNIVFTLRRYDPWSARGTTLHRLSPLDPAATLP